MRSFTVHLPPLVSEEERLAQAVFVRDGFHAVALLAPPLWLLWYRQWLGLALYIVAMLVLDFSAEYVSVWAILIVNLLFGIGLALEASTLRRWRLDARGWQMAAALSAHDLEDAELRFFSGLAQGNRRPVQPVPAILQNGLSSTRPSTGAATPSIIGYQ
uniref:DUF2628 domain-containing protein n=1 Tax=Pararhizobium sp. IMCC3301 TaxID=3067904 RepID=UPI00274138EE|nr:DUF2628 domain-containing protein [Pararhizobium sp. IMCC3301]